MPFRNIYKYRLDLTGEHPDNRQTGELHTVGVGVMRIFVPDQGPFYGHNLVVTSAATGAILEPLQDFILLHTYKEAQEVAAKSVYCAIKIVNPDITGEISIDVSYIGGEFSYTTAALIQVLEDLESDDRLVEWGQLLGVPDGFNPIRHLHSAYDIYGQKHLVAAVMQVNKTLEQGYLTGQEMLFQMLDDRLATIRTIPGTLADIFAAGTLRIRNLL